MTPTWSKRTLDLITAACEEDLGTAGDITSALLAVSDEQVSAGLVARQAGVICGLALGPDICATFSRRLGATLQFTPASRGEQPCADGASVSPGTCVATISGPRAAVLTVERTLLNFLTHLSGVATLTRRYVQAARAVSPAVKILDTRKTLPGWRELHKYAVRIAGGTNHRFGLHDAVLIKDNHLAGIPVGGLATALEEMLARLTTQPSFVEVEIDSLAQLPEVCRVQRVDIVLLDNFTPEQMREAVAQRDAAGRDGRPELEASGGVTFERIADIAATGVDRISCGALTHSAPALDIGLDL
ncbi:MAG: carboxylating nicotinate-nucleotide diphosphorylase [Phycisphaerae bacterium]|jgi:nicotinate-nucleotide pyrophosphorylase (carboxylating)